jgi:iron(III) transport system permease protein
MTSSLPGIVTALALVTVTIHYARPSTRPVTLFLAYLLMFMPRALINLRGIAQAPVELENVARVWAKPRRAGASHASRRAGRDGRGRAGLSRRQQRTDRHAAAFTAGNPHAGHRLLGANQRDRLWRAAPYAMLMIAISLPLTGVLYHQSKKLQVCKCWN